MLPLLVADATRERSFNCLDLVQVPTLDPPGDWTWMVLSTAATEVYQHTIGLGRGERWRFATTVAGVERIYVAHRIPSVAHDKVSSMYGPHAADRARRDRNSVCLGLSLEQVEDAAGAGARRDSDGRVEW